MFVKNKFANPRNLSDKISVLQNIIPLSNTLMMHRINLEILQPMPDQKITDSSRQSLPSHTSRNDGALIFDTQRLLG